MSGKSMFRLTEIGIAVEDLDQAITKFEAVFGSKADPVLEFSDPGVEMKFSLVHVGDQRINLLQPLGEKSPVGRVIARRGEGFFNVFFQVPDLDAAMERMREAGVEFVEAEPRDFGAGSYDGRSYDSNRVTWTRPNTFHGLLAEIQEYGWTSDEPAPNGDGSGSLFRGIPEIGVAVKDLEKAIAQFEAIFGVEAAPVVEAPVPGVEMRFTWVDVGDRRINLYQDLGDSGPIARAIKRNGEGIFNVMLEVDDIPAAIEPLRAAGLEFVEPEPRVLTNGSHGGRRYDRHRVLWTHPRSLHGMLVEIQDFDWTASAA
jgi:methylmalonyl-CoA/ethylmalonyl-CoA epimerase